MPGKTYTKAQEAKYKAKYGVTAPSAVKKAKAARRTTKAAADSKYVAKRAYKKTTRRAYKSRASSSSSSSTVAVARTAARREVQKSSMGPFVGRKTQTITDEFRLGEYIDNGTTTVGHNQIFEIIPINPVSLVNVAKSNAESQRHLQETYQMEGMNAAHVRYRFDDLSFQVCNLVPQTVSGNLMAFVVPDALAATNQSITPENVLDVFDSIRGADGRNSENAIVVEPGKCGWLKLPQTALLYLKNNNTSPAISEDPRLSSSGAIVIAAMSAFTAGLAVASTAVGGNPGASRSFGGEVCMLKVKAKVTYVDKEYIPFNPVQRRDGPTLDEPIQDLPGPAVVTPAWSTATVQVPAQMPTAAAPATVTTMMVAPLVTQIPPDIDAAAANSSYASLLHGEPQTRVNSVGRSAYLMLEGKPVINYQANPVLVEPGVLEFSWSGALDWVTSAVGGYVKGKLNWFFGDYLGDAIYDVGKSLMYSAASLIGIPEPGKVVGNVSVPGANSCAWNAYGWPSDWNGNPVVGPIQPNSTAFFQALEAFRLLNPPTLYNAVQAAIEIGSQIAFSAFTPASYVGNPGVPGSGASVGAPYVGSSGTEEYEVFIGDGDVLHVKPGFGKPAVTGTELSTAFVSTRREMSGAWIDALPLNQTRPVLDSEPVPVSFLIWTQLGATKLAAFLSSSVVSGVENYVITQADMQSLIDYFKASLGGQILQSAAYTSVTLTGHIGPIKSTGVWAPVIDEEDETFPQLVIPANTIATATPSAEIMGIVCDDIFPVDLRLKMDYSLPRITEAVIDFKRAVYPDVTGNFYNYQDYTLSSFGYDRWLHFVGTVKRNYQTR